MKKSIVLSLAIAILLLANTAAFAVFVENAKPDAGFGGYQFVEVKWTHSYDWSVGDDVKATLSILADDVDAASGGNPAEIDEVYLNGNYLGNLNSYGAFDNNRPGGAPQNTSVTVFDVTPYLASIMELRIKVFMGATRYAMEMINSTLTVAPTPIPAAFWMLGTGLVGLFGLRRRVRG